MAVAGGPNIVEDGLVLALDAANVKSYPGSGTTVYDLVGEDSASMANQLQYSSNDAGVLQSDGSGDSLIIPHSTRYNLTACTLEGFVWWDQHKNYASLLVKGPGGSGQLFNYSFFFYETNIRFGIGNGSSYVYVTINVTDLPISTWHHIVGTYDLSAMKFYLNGALKVQSSQNFTPKQNTDDLQVLQSPYNLDGYLGPVRLYNRALTSSEVLQNYNATKGRFGL